MGRLCICMCGGASLCLWVFGGLRAAVWRCVSNASGAWAPMVLRGVAGVFETRHLLCDEEHYIAFEGLKIY